VLSAKSAIFTKLYKFLLSPLVCGNVDLLVEKQALYKLGSNLFVLIEARDFCSRNYSISANKVRVRVMTDSVIKYTVSQMPRSRLHFHLTSSDH